MPDPPLSRRELRRRRDSGIGDRDAGDEAVAPRPEERLGLWDDVDMPDWALEPQRPERHRSSFIPAEKPPRVESHTPHAPSAGGGATPPVEPSVASRAERRRILTPDLADPRHAAAQHQRGRRAAGVRLVFGAAAAVALAVGGGAAITAALISAPLSPASGLIAAETPLPEATAEESPVPLPQAVEALPAPTLAAAPAIVDVCAIPAFTAALAAGDDTGAIAAAGGAEVFRTSVAAGAAGCVSLGDAARVWTVVNKTRPFEPADYRPASLANPVVRDISAGDLRADAAASLESMFAAVSAAGAGELALDSGYRSYRTQRTTYQRLVSAKGVEGADLVSARPGFSEHQSGLAADVTACTPGCVGLESFAGTAQQQWVAAHSWEFGWIVRYEDECTAITGYSPEPWHLRYIGPELAAAYHAGGWRTLEEFFGLPGAPDYVD